MKLIEKENEITVSELQEMARKMFGNLVKAVVDVEQGVMIIDADLHSDEEAQLIERGSKQKNLWGINFYPELTGDDFVEFDSMINLRPSQDNRSRGVEDEKIRQKIMKIVDKLVFK